MKKFLLTAAALTLGTSAFAWTADKDATITANSGATTMASMYAAPALKAAEVKGWEADTAVSAKLADPVKLASADVQADSWATATKVDTAGSEDTAGYAMSKDAGAAMGGPAEDMWPACRPGPGDDNCIQLYEPGVTTALAALKSGAETGMGGPLEPVPEEAKPAADDVDHSAMGHDADAAAGAKVETPVSDAEIEAATAAKTAATASPSAIGGPVEARTGYPACSATITDSCIQLHERGVTGNGN
jgi:hypothetical protein